VKHGESEAGGNGESRGQRNPRVQRERGEWKRRGRPLRGKGASGSLSKVNNWSEAVQDLKD